MKDATTTSSCPMRVACPECTAIFDAPVPPEADRDRRFAQEVSYIINRDGSGVYPTIERIREAERRIYGTLPATCEVPA